MSQFDDHEKPEQPTDSLPLFKWVASILGSLSVLLIFNSYTTNQKMLQTLTAQINNVENRQTELRVRLNELERRLDRTLKTPPHDRQKLCANMVHLK
jgi:hypothetical protein